MMKIVSPHGLFTAAICLTISHHLCTAETHGEMKLVHTFSLRAGDGWNSEAALIEGPGGALFGTTTDGGPQSYGTVFTVKKDGTGYRTLHRFAGNQTDGRSAASGLLDGADGFLYGTTAFGGIRDLGIIFKIAPDGTAYQLLHKFTGGASGSRPYGPLIGGKDNTLLGTAMVGGDFGGGVLFQLKTNGAGYRILHHFGRSAEDGKSPRGHLLRASDGQFYGTTADGGAHGAGVVFVIAEDGDRYRILHAFANRPADGASPYAGVIEGSDGKLYGTTKDGGSASRGVVFRLNKDGGAYEVLRHFTGLGKEGRNPHCKLVEGDDGLLYGTTLAGGSGSTGIIFRLARDGGNYQLLHTFTHAGPEGRGPYGGVVRADKGVFYGATTAGGVDNLGAIFRLITSKP